MKAQLIGFLHALQHHQHQIVMDYFFLSALSWSYWVKIRSTMLGTVLIGALVALSIFAGFAYILTIALYLLYPNYLDHIQPTVASISWLWMHGHKLYPNWMSGEIYGLVYGPVLFLINGMALLLSPSIFTSKLPGVLSLGTALGATWLLLTWKTSSLASLFLLAALIMVFVPFDEFAYSNRAEPFLILVSVLALLLAVRSSSLVAGVGIGVLAGLAIGLKLHGFVYTIPAAAVTLARVKTPSGRVLMAIIGSACAVASALPPYLEKDVSIISYLRFLTLELDNGLSSSLRPGVLPATLLIENLLFAFILTAPLVGILIWRKPTLNTPDRCLLAALGISVAVAAVIGATSGGGAYHLLPLAPICIYGIAVVCESSKTETRTVAALIFVSFFLGYGPQLYLRVRSLIGLYHVADPSEREKIAELKTYLSSYPQAQIGISDQKHYRDYFYRVFSVWNGRPLDIDFSAWMDMANAGLDEKHIVRFIEGCTVPTWILPLGPPFTMFNWYTDLPLLSESFRTTFSTNYRQIEAGRAYQVWTCQSPSRG